VSANRQYLSLKPVGIQSKIHVYRAFAVGVLARIFRRKHFVTIGQYLKRDALVKYEGLLFKARARSDDLGFYAHTVKSYTFNWFRPSAGETVVDCGSSVGLFTMIALKNGAQVYAFEANPKTFKVLQENVALNGFHKAAHLFNIGLSCEPGEMTLYAPKNFTGTSSFNIKWVWNMKKDKDDIEQFRVPVITLDEAMDGVKKIDWLLIDVESFEYNLLLGSAKTLERTRNIIIEISSFQSEKLHKLLQDHGFCVSDRGDREGSVQYFLYTKC
jgi:FkbM family methyltransferase